MKQLWSRALLVIIVLHPLIGWSAPDEPEDLIDSVVTCLKKHDASMIVEYMNDPIDLKINGKKGIYSVGQAQVILADFFKKNPAKSFTKNHVSESGNNEVSVIGTYTSTNQTYRVYFLIKEDQGKYTIYQFYIEKS